MGYGAGVIGVDRDLLAGTDPADVVAALVPLLVAAAVAGEVGWLFLHGDRRAPRSAAVAAAMGVGGLVAAAALAGVVALQLAWWSDRAPDALVELWAAQPVLGGVVAFVAYDAVGYVHHLVGHRTALGWAAHQPHHTGLRFELSLALRQSWLPVHGVLILPIVAVGGWGPLTLVACAAVSRLLQALQHTSAEWPVPDSVRAIVMTPRQHRVHHATAAAVNLGPVLTCWDRLARTYHPGSAGVRPEPAPALAAGDHPVRHQLAGWRTLLSGERPLHPSVAATVAPNARCYGS